MVAVVISMCLISLRFGTAIYAAWILSSEFLQAFSELLAVGPPLAHWFYKALRGVEASLYQANQSVLLERVRDE